MIEAAVRLVRNMTRREPRVQDRFIQQHIHIIADYTELADSDYLSAMIAAVEGMVQVERIEDDPERRELTFFIARPNGGVEAKEG